MKETQFVWLCALSSWTLVCPAAGAGPSADVSTEFPVPESIDFSSDKIPSEEHPFLFITVEHVADARKRSTERSYRVEVDSLAEQADKAHGLVITSVDPGWWEEVKEKSWRETYPIIYQKTSREPGGMMRPGYYAALRYLIEGNEADLAAAKRILMHLSDYSFEFEHYDVGMNYAVWGHLALNTYDMLFDHFSSDERARIDAFFTRMARAVLENDIYWIENDIGGGINNHLAWHKMMLGCLGVFYDREDLVEFALDGPRGILPLLDDGMVDDGLWCESSLNYHFTAIVPMVYLAEAMRQTGHPKNLYRMTTPRGRSLRQAYDSMFGVLFSDTSIPPVGDAYGRHKRLHDEFTYVHAQKAYGDPRYAWLLDKSKFERPELLFVGRETGKAQTPEIGSRVYREHGYAFLRDRSDGDYWDSDAFCAFLTGDKSGVHHNRDKLSLMLFGCGKLLIPDVEARATVPHAFSAKIQRELNRSALSQNTVMIDGRDQKAIGETLEIVEFRDTANQRTVTMVDVKGLLYDGVRQSRTICMRPEYILDVFQLSMDSEHNLDWIIHTIGTAQSQRSSIALERVEREVSGPGSSWLRDFRAATSDDQFRIVWSEDSVRFALTMAACPETEFVTCGYPTTDEPDCPSIPMLLVRRRAAETVYVAVYQAGRARLPNLDVGPLKSYGDRLAVSVTGPWGRREHDIPSLRRQGGD